MTAFLSKMPPSCESPLGLKCGNALVYLPLQKGNFLLEDGCNRDQALSHLTIEILI